MANGYGYDPDLSNPQVTWTKTLTDEQIRVLEILGDIIIPKDEYSPKASDLNIVDFLNEWLSAPYDEQKKHQGFVLSGLDYLDTQAKQRTGRAFYDISAEEQSEIFRRLVDYGQADYDQLPNNEKYLHSFFNTLVYLFVGGFYTTDEGMEDIGYVGNELIMDKFKIEDFVLERVVMDLRFSEIINKPENSVFRVVFYPDRIYHAEYLNATRSNRYQYHVQEVRNKSDITVLKGQVYMDGLQYSNFIRIEYRAGRLVEASRERGRVLRDAILAEINLPDTGAETTVTVKMFYCRMIDAYQVELWETLEPPENNYHDFKVLSIMGAECSITSIPQLGTVLSDLKSLRRIKVKLRENNVNLPFGNTINDPAWDDNYQRNHQVPNTPQPNSATNTVMEYSYLIDFQRGWYLEADNVEPVRYENAMMDTGNPDSATGNVIEMRWLLQQELGGDLVFFHEVTIPPGKVEGTHRHIGSEELYYVVEGQGVAYMGENDDPKLAHLPVVERDIFGMGTKKCKEINVKPGSVIYTKSGGIHGIRNPGYKPLKFVAFLYQGS